MNVILEKNFFMVEKRWNNELYVIYLILRVIIICFILFFFIVDINFLEFKIVVSVIYVKL